MTTGFLYLMGREDGRVKVGYSKHPRRRLSQIKSGLGMDVELLWTFPGSLTTEAQLHALLAPARVRGEWYESLESVMRVVRNAIDKDVAISRGVLDPRGIA